MYVMDTDHVTLYQQAHPTLWSRISLLPSNQLATTVITYEEQVSGRIAQIRRVQAEIDRIRAYFWLQRTLDFFCRMPILPFEERAAEKYRELKKQKIRVGTQDLLIASIVLAQDRVLLTRNWRHFSQVPDLQIEDWSIPL